MADFVINEEVVRTIPAFRKTVTLAAGEKIADDEEILALAQKIVPSGYEIDVTVRIKVSEIRSV